LNLKCHRITNKALKRQGACLTVYLLVYSQQDKRETFKTDHTESIETTARMETLMPIEVKNFTNQADETKEMPNARMEAVNVLGQRVMKLTLAPEWKWSADIKPIVGTDSCQATHTGIIVEGTVHCVCDDGSEATYKAGDAYAISPNHDAWCVGGKRAVVYEFAGMWGE
jgi:hypothetical protein